MNSDQNLVILNWQVIREKLIAIVVVVLLGTLFTILPMILVGYKSYFKWIPWLTCFAAGTMMGLSLNDFVIHPELRFGVAITKAAALSLMFLLSMIINFYFSNRIAFVGGDSVIFTDDENNDEDTKYGKASKNEQQRTGSFGKESISCIFSCNKNVR